MRVFLPNANRYFYHYSKEDGTRSFITAQSLKKLKAQLSVSLILQFSIEFSIDIRRLS